MAYWIATRKYTLANPPLVKCVASAELFVTAHPRRFQELFNRVPKESELTITHDLFLMNKPHFGIEVAEASIRPVSSKAASEVTSKLIAALHLDDALPDILSEELRHKPHHKVTTYPALSISANQRGSSLHPAATVFCARYNIPANNLSNKHRGAGGSSHAFARFVQDHL